MIESTQTQPASRGNLPPRQRGTICCLGWVTLLAATSAVACAGVKMQRVEILFRVPDVMIETGYTGLQPLTFGVPFERGTLRLRDGLRAVDEQGKTVPAQFEVTSTWGRGSDAVQWLLVDLLVEIRGGHAPRTFLEFGPGVQGTPNPPAWARQRSPDEVMVDTGAETFIIGRDGGTVGRFELHLDDGRGPRIGTAEATEIGVELAGPVRSVVRLAGDYRTPSGKSLGRFVTRIRFYEQVPFVRLYHTMIWTADGEPKIERLEFRAPAPGRSSASFRAGLDHLKLGPSSRLELAQLDANRAVVRQEPLREGKRHDGWIEAAFGNETLFAALRWPWQQFPTGLAAGDGAVAVRMVEGPLSLRASDNSVLEPENWEMRVAKRGGGFCSCSTRRSTGEPVDCATRDCPVSPFGVAKTWELLRWRSSSLPPVSPELKNSVVQEPVLAYADPEFATRAGLPSPSSARDADRFEVIESALERSFAWFTRSISLPPDWRVSSETEKGRDGDYGTFDWGDLQWHWNPSGNFAPNRYWMNQGKGWSVLPWVLWLRSGERVYWDNGEANARHVMDVDTAHLDSPPSTHEEDAERPVKRRGAVYVYNAGHWFSGPHPIVPRPGEPSGFHFVADSEYLVNNYFMTGYERARDVIEERVAFLASSDPDDWLQYKSRDLYAMLKELCVLFEATHSAQLEDMAKLTLDRVLRTQEPSGRFPGNVSNHYLDQGLHVAARIFPQDRERILASLDGWERYLGNHLQPGAFGAALGPESLWTIAELAATGPLPKLGGSVALAQAWTSAVGPSLELEGMPSFPADKAGPILRDWTIAMAALAKAGLRESDLKPAPALYAHGRLPPPPTGEARHLLLIAEEADARITVDLHFMLANSGGGPIPVQVRAFAPGAAADAQPIVELPWFDLQSASAESQQLVIPPDEKVGLYTVEILSVKVRGFIPPIYARSSTGKLVHCLPPEGVRNLVSPTGGGVVWILPDRDAERFVLHFPRKTGFVKVPDGCGLPKSSYSSAGWARNVAFDASGALAASSQIGERGPGKGGYPEGCPLSQEIARLDAAGIFRVTVGTDDYSMLHVLEGTAPFVAVRESEWFDPTQVGDPLGANVSRCTGSAAETSMLR